MKAIADTNVLVRAVVEDDARQARAAQKVLREAELVAVPLSSLCEFVWVLRSVYRYKLEEIAAAVGVLLEADNVALDRPAVDAGLAILRAGGDFADGVVAHEGSWLGGEVFVSFDAQAVDLIGRQGQQVRLLR